jgi:hypothetical protein
MMLLKVLLCLLMPTASLLKPGKYFLYDPFLVTIAICRADFSSPNLASSARMRSTIRVQSIALAVHRPGVHILIHWLIFFNNPLFVIPLEQ